MSKIGLKVLFFEVAFLFFGAFYESGFFIWSSVLSVLVFRTCISTLEGPKLIKFAISPLTIYKSFWYFLLVVSPLMNNIWRPPQFPLPFLPSNDQNNQALLLIALAAFFSSLGYRMFARRARLESPSRLINPAGSRLQPKVMILIGLVGVSLLLGLTVLSVGVNNSFVALTPAASSLPKFLSIILPPFLIHGIVLWMSSNPNPKIFDYLKFFALLGISLIPFSLYRLNRASIFVPILALMIPLVRTKSKLSLLMVWFLLIALGGFAVQSVGNYRAQMLVTKGGQLSLETSGYVKGPSFKTAVFNYLNASEYVGYGLQEIDRQEFSVFTPLYSVAGPLPELSRFDAQKIGGSGIYNRAVYNKNVYDQICSTVLEVFLAWGILGLSLFFLVQGWLMRFIQSRFEDNLHLYPKFFLSYSGFWVAFTPCISISVLTQIFFYNVLFIVLFLKLLRFKNQESL
jgi:hypothetical protein